MKFFKLKNPSDNVIALLIVFTCILFLFIWLSFLYYLIDMRFFFPVLMLCLWPIIVLSRSSFFKYLVTIDKQKMTIIYKPYNIKREIFISDIALLKTKYNKRKGITRLKIITHNGKVILECVDSKYKDDFFQFFKELMSQLKIEIVSYDNGNDYINLDYKDSSVVRKNISNRKQTRSLIISGILFILFLIFILPQYRNFLDDLTSNRIYSIREDGVYYQNKKIELADQQNFKSFGRDVGKDENHIYYRGTVIENVDVNSFEYISTFIYKDKNGVYTVDPDLIPIFPVKKFILLEDIDPDSFREEGELFVNKTHIYKHYYKYPYIREIDFPSDLDLESFEYTKHRRDGKGDRYKDKNFFYKFSRKNSLLIRDSIQ